MEGKEFNGKIETIIGKETKFFGLIESTENIRIDGKHDGELSTKGDLLISETGEVQGRFKVRNLLIAGAVQGETDINGKLKILSTGNFRGEATMSILEINEGAGFQGKCQQNKAK